MCTGSFFVYMLRLHHINIPYSLYESFKRNDVWMKFTFLFYMYSVYYNHEKISLFQGHASWLKMVYSDYKKQWIQLRLGYKSPF